jgi:hypothetical protein
MESYLNELAQKTGWWDGGLVLWTGSLEEDVLLLV